jgi:alkanesulfonate monooxygenase SsuD/methylene tetrahydromethanopterin reductase-like flavin-dependent oxidoreductase (luciferase family)
MYYGVNVPAFGDFADPYVLAELAHAAEQAGWDGFCIWDHIVFDPSFHPMLDPWIGLATVALHTARVPLGTMITPLARRRPWKVVRETVTLDRLSQGRLIFSVGLGDPVQWDFGLFGEQTDAKFRAQQLDESLAIFTGLWHGEPFHYHGDHYQVQEVIFRPRSVQVPRIPIWVGGWWPNTPPLRRAARWDGVVPGKWGDGLTCDDWRELLAYIAQHRTSAGPFDAVPSGRTTGIHTQQDLDMVAAYADAGITWLIEDINPWRFG